MRRYRHDTSAPSHLRELVESARGDDLDAERRRAVAKRLGIRALPEAPRVASNPKPSEQSLGARGSLGGIALGAMVLVGLTAVSVVVTQRSSSPSLVAVPPVVATTAAIESPNPPPPVTSDSLPSDPVESVAALPAQGPTAKASPTPSVIPHATKGGDLRLEIAALDTVRRATEGGRPREALTLLVDYAARFPEGKLREEALVLRIEALHASGGDSAESAARLARQVLRDSPNTPYAARVRSALEDGNRRPE